MGGRGVGFAGAGMELCSRDPDLGRSSRAYDHHSGRYHGPAPQCCLEEMAQAQGIAARGRRGIAATGHRGQRRADCEGHEQKTGDQDRALESMRDHRNTCSP